MVGCIVCRKKLKLTIVPALVHPESDTSSERITLPILTYGYHCENCNRDTLTDDQAGIIFQTYGRTTHFQTILSEEIIPKSGSLD